MTFVIAEIGVNHCGDYAIALKLVEAAKKVGANAVKFQTYNAERLEPPGTRRELMRSLELSFRDHFDLKNSADRLGIEFISTPFDVESLRFLAEDVGVRTIKIASGNLDNWPLLEAARKSGCGVILSTGMGALDEVSKADLALSDPCSSSEPIVLLHCTSAYPTYVGDVNLLAMAAIGQRTYGKVGLSDHTRSLVIPAAAVAMGATVVEKHLTLDRNMDGPDHKASLEPDEFAEMVRNIREVEKALGDGVKAPRECEAATMKVIEERKAWRTR